MFCILVFCVLAGMGLVKVFSILATGRFPKIKLLSNLGNFPVYAVSFNIV